MYPPASSYSTSSTTATTTNHATTTTSTAYRHSSVSYASTPLPRPILKRSPSTCARTAPKVHFPPPPELTCTFSAYSSTTYDRSPIVVSPNACALPERGSPGRTYILEDESALDTSSSSSSLSSSSGSPSKYACRIPPDLSGMRSMSLPSPGWRSPRQSAKKRIVGFDAPDAYSDDELPTTAPDLVRDASSSSSGSSDSSSDSDFSRSFASLSLSSANSSSASLLRSSSNSHSQQSKLVFLPHPHASLSPSHLHPHPNAPLAPPMGLHAQLQDQSSRRKKRLSPVRSRPAKVPAPPPARRSGPFDGNSISVWNGGWDSSTGGDKDRNSGCLDGFW